MRAEQLAGNAGHALEQLSQDVDLLKGKTEKKRKPIQVNEKETRRLYKPDSQGDKFV